jgi:hypothetical protein
VSAVARTTRRDGIEAAIEARGADIYAGFFLPHLRPDMVILDCGCGEATISIGLSEAVPAGRVVGVISTSTALQLPAAMRPQLGGAISL